ncbi:MAG: hypothetical protein H9Q66_04675 [Spiroplasma ixodetis]|nr:hypothetical protein [Spiroplasma ixodetis]
MVKTAVKKADRPTNTVEIDRRGLTSSHNRLANSITNSVRDHIKLFPAIDSHYCRKNSKRRYLAADLNVTKMYELYKTYCTEKSLEPAKLSKYRSIFNSEFNLTFFKPKKDQCDLCERFKNSEKSTEMVAILEEHELSKIAARNAKEDAKIRAREENNFCAAVFDLQQVLQTPHAEISQLYYRRKYSSYNLSVYDFKYRNGFCYMWTENDGQRGSNEVASCVYKFILHNVNENNINEFCFFSDNCGGQNLNRNIVAMYIHAAVNYKVTIMHCFLEKGHTQNEGDSIHSAVESASRNINIYSPVQWYTLVRTARRKNPYHVIEMKDQFQDFLQFRNATMNDLNKHADNTRVKWQKIRVIKAEAGNNEEIFVKYKYSDDFQGIPIRNKPARKNSKRSLSNIKNYPLQNPYSDDDPRLYITQEKYKDLTDLCKLCIIPSEYHDFYFNLKHYDSKKDNKLTNVDEEIIFYDEEGL